MVIQRMAQENVVGGRPGMTGFCASAIGGLLAGLFAAAACAPTGTDFCDTVRKLRFVLGLVQTVKVSMFLLLPWLLDCNGARGVVG
jgi:hypothetical protein